MIIGGGDVDPSSAKDGSNQTDGANKLWSKRAGLRGEQVPESDKGEAGASGDGDKELEEGTLGVAIANGGGYRREPLLGVALGNVRAMSPTDRG